MLPCCGRAARLPHGSWLGAGVDPDLICCWWRKPSAPTWRIHEGAVLDAVNNVLDSDT